MDIHLGSVRHMPTGDGNDTPQRAEGPYTKVDTIRVNIANPVDQYVNRAIKVWEDVHGIQKDT